MADEDKGADLGAQDTSAADKGTGTILDSADKGGAADKGSDQTADKGADVSADKGTADANKGTAQPDWRTRLAGEDKDALKRLARFPDEATFYKSYRALESKLSSGEFKRALPETASDEEKATWRKENGIPEKPEDYFGKLQLSDGVVLGETDKPIVAEFAAAALEENVTPAQLSKLVSKYYAIQDAQRIAQEDKDAEFRKTSEDALRADWNGPDYRRNLNAVQNLMSKWPEGLADRILVARDHEGRKLGDDATFIKQLAAISLELNPFSTLLPAGTSDPAKSAADELESIRELRRNDPAKYEADKKLQARELELIETTLKVKNRAA